MKRNMSALARASAALLLGAALMGTAGVTAAPQAGGDSLIPRAKIFGNPSRSGGQISPDGKHVSWLAPVNGVMNVWVAPIGNLAAGKPLTKETKRGLQSYFWAPDAQHIIYQQDAGGNENFRIHSVAIATGADIALTKAGDKVRAQIEGVSKDRPDVVLVGLNDRNPQFFDLYEVNYRTGASKMVMQNPGYGQWVTDNQLKPRFAMSQVPGGGTKLFRLDAQGKGTEVAAIGVEDALTTTPIGFNKDGSTLYWVDSRGRDKAALVKMDVTSLKTDVIAASDRADIQGLLTDPQTYEPIAYSVNYLRNEWTPLRADAKADFDFLKSKLPGEVSIISSTDDGSKLIVAASAAEQPASAYIYDRKAKSLTKLYDTRPDLAVYKLRPMWPVEIPTGDGKTLVSYLTLPAAADANNDGKADKAVPMVLFVHGGPWARDAYGYNSAHQWLADRGYAVLSVNYRGSTGFGKGFVNSAIGEWSGKMHQDLIDAVDWSIKGGVTTKDKVAIMGGSYGGYATLVGLTFTPDTFACGVDIVGPSNLKTLMESFPAYWRPILEGTFYKHIGDPGKPEDVTRMMAQSPISRVDAIKKPLLIGQGGNDPRVVKAESDQIVAAMKAKKLPVTYINYPDEGHGFVRPENRLSFFGISEGFLGKCLGGRVQPIGDDFKGSSLQVLEGASFVPGLAEAAPKVTAQK
ncbi:alpha/beta hydrolase family protein [Sphingomonas turrisvirgatae]|uniref:Peptidase S9 n=1 Tax=Sphingomonas turrisvirgatae TaxID=1888892 RepID=A0A1E3LWV6_9SPHN|nr:S9 family peptidase [Sphingomonas turrisvirgatae]ODP38198.1 peptidase S9 [Sphingomonas turrisvirgatae]